MICDLCNNQGQIRWTYVTPNTAASLEQAQGPVVDGVPLYWAEDPEWAVCQPCHLLIQIGDREGLLRRSILVQSMQQIIIGDEDGALWQKQVEGIAEIHRGFWNNLSSEPPIPEPGYRMDPMTVEIVDP